MAHGSAIIFVKNELRFDATNAAGIRAVAVELFLVCSPIVWKGRRPLRLLQRGRLESNDDLVSRNNADAVLACPNMAPNYWRWQESNLHLPAGRRHCHGNGSKTGLSQVRGRPHTRSITCCSEPSDLCR
jgi:hypothetical protein